MRLFLEVRRAWYCYFLFILTCVAWSHWESLQSLGVIMVSQHLMHNAFAGLYIYYFSFTITGQIHFYVKSPLNNFLKGFLCFTSHGYQDWGNHHIIYIPSKCINNTNLFTEYLGISYKKRLLIVNMNVTISNI